LIRDVGLMSYVVHPDHRHWHLLNFERYEVRTGDAAAVLATDHKTGFCLGDRYPAPGGETLPGFSPVALQGDTCGLGQPDLTGLFVGISIGWADRYAAHLEGQYVDVTDLESGDYVLVHRLNLDGKIAETDYSNDASSVRFRLTVPADGSTPSARVLRRCPGADACPALSPNTVREGHTLGARESRQSRNGVHRVIMQEDGDLVVERYGAGVVWSSGTAGHPGATATVQRDGNLVIRAATGEPIWATDSAGSHGGDRLVMQNDGNLVLYSGENPLWSSYNGRVP
jgi:hypothetical protein